MITMITREKTLISLQGYNLPYMLAAHWYRGHSDLNFLQDVNHYLIEGHILSTPGVFVMGKPVDLEGEAAFFIRFACGRLEELVTHLPKNVKWIAFCRRNEGNIRKYRIDRLGDLGTIGQLTSPIFSMKMESNGQEPL